jgi:hypothetical protein
LVAPLFILMLFIAWQLCQLTLAQMELAGLARELALSRGRAYAGGPDMDQDTEVIRRLSARCRHLDPSRLNLTEQSVSLPGVSGMLGGLSNTGDRDLEQPASQGFIGKAFGRLFGDVGGRRLVLSYRFQFKGPFKKLAPKDLVLSESLVCKANCWTMRLSL